MNGFRSSIAGLVLLLILSCLPLDLARAQTPTPTSMPTSTSTPTDTPTPPSTPTAIPTVSLGMSDIITTTHQLADDQVSAWSTSADTAPLFLGLASLLFVFGLLSFIKAITLWGVQHSEE